MIVCAGCERPIMDRYLLNVLDRAWHTRCVTCSDCSAPLTEKCFSRDGKLFCKNDFFIRFGTKCAGCTLGISPSDLVRKAKNKVFHLRCFTCLICRKELSTGEELYIMEENKFICKDDYIASKLAGSDVEDDVDYECDKDGEHEVDLDTKNDLYLQNSDNNHVTRYNNNNNQLNNHFNDVLSNSESPDNTDAFLPPSPLGQHLQENGLSLNTKTPSSIRDTVPMSPGVKDEPMDQLSDSCPSPGGHSQDSSKISILNPGSNCSSLEPNDNNNNKEGGNEKEKNKRRGPRTTIKAKQLEVLKASFNATPKPTRHIREQLAAETGLNMRVIQVWFQNRRSKERRMKQLSALGARRHFFSRNPRRMRPLQPGELDEHEIMAGGGYGYFNDNGQDFYPGYIGHGYGGEFFPGQGPEMPPGMPLLPPHGRSSPPLGMENQLPPHPGAHMVPDAHYLHQDVIPHNPSPEPLMHPDDQYMMSLPPRSLPGPYTPHSAENWS